MLKFGNHMKTIASILLGLGILLISPYLAGDELIIGKPFGPSVNIPDPAVGSNGWYNSEAGITETLFVLDFDMSLKPWLVENYERKDSTQWEITLKKGISFHDGSPLNADAVKGSFDRLIQVESSVFNKRIQELLDIKSITVQNDETLVFVTNKPNAGFLYDLTTPETGIVAPSSSKEAVFGTGPYRLEKVIPNQEVITRDFDGYWRGKPGFSKVFLKTIRNPATRMLAFEAGQLDIAVNFPEHDARRIMDRQDVNIFHQPTSRLCFFFVRTADGPLADPRIRKAINHALDREEIVNAVLAGLGGKVGASIFPELLPWCNRRLKPYSYHPETASRLLAEAGAADRNGDGELELNDRPFVLNMWTYEGRASLKPALELVQSQLKRVGIGSRLKITKKGSPINMAMSKGEVHMNLQMWNTAPQGDPDYFISNVFTGTSESNFMGYRNSELDALAEKGKITFDPDERKQIYDRIQEIIYEESPVIVLFHKSMVTAVRGDIENYRIHPAEKYIMTHRLHRKPSSLE